VHWLVDPPVQVEQGAWQLAHVVAVWA